jgi:hypothetical protein
LSGGASTRELRAIRPKKVVLGDCLMEPERDLSKAMREFGGGASLSK